MGALLSLRKLERRTCKHATEASVQRFQLELLLSPSVESKQQEILLHSSVIEADPEPPRQPRNQIRF